jgi:hypothetical protein
MTLAHAALLMEAFLDRTGVTSDAETRRYLWTDAFAVSNLLELSRRTGLPRYRDEAAALIGQVHRVLGRHRPDDKRQGWLSGLSEERGEQHPTAGGLRIGKPLPERRPDEPMDERLEWDREGQYFHYLTKWMDALRLAAADLRQPHYQTQAVELAEAAYACFLQRSRTGAPQGLAWKMSIDLSRPLVSDQSPHDLLDGYVTFRSLAAPTALGEAIGVLWTLTEGQSWGTSDALGLGGLLLDAARLARLPDRSAADDELMGRILSGVVRGLRFLLEGRGLDGPAEHRLAFRELGLAIGLNRLAMIADVADESPALAGQAGRYLAALARSVPVGEHIVSFWSDERNRRSPSWTDHRDINEVMLATALLGS